MWTRSISRAPTQRALHPSDKFCATVAVLLCQCNSHYVSSFNIITNTVTFTDGNIGHPMKETVEGQREGHGGGTVTKFYTHSPKA